jgi:hypothetical protein
VTHYDPNLDPRRANLGATGQNEGHIPGPTVTETVETVVVRESNTGWWIAGILGALVVLAVLWILFARGGEPQAETAVLDAQIEAAQAQAQADQARVASQVAGAQASVEIARAEAARSQAEAARAAAEAQAAEARSEPPVVIEAPGAGNAPTSAPAVVRPTSPQN